MAVPKETHLERLAAAERILFRKLSDIKSRVEHDGIVWQPPGWGMEYWKKGLRFRLTAGGEATHFNVLDTEDLRAMMEKFDSFVEYVKTQQGLDIEPPPATPGPGLGHYFKTAVSKAYRKECAEISKEEQVRDALEKLRATRDDAREKLDDLEKQEKAIIKEGKAEKSIEIKRRLAGRLAALRKDISRENSTVQFAARQLSRCEDFLHTRKMARLAGTTGLPDTEDIVENQAEAELAIEAADAAAEAAESVEFDYLDEEAEACMKEFEIDAPETDGETTAETDTASAEALAEFDAVDGDGSADETDETADEAPAADKAKHTA